MNKLELKRKQLQEQKEKKQLTPETKQELNRFEKNEYRLFGLLQLLADKGLINHNEIQEYCIEGIQVIKPVKEKKQMEDIIELSPEDEIRDKPKSKLEIMKEKIKQRKGV